MYDAIMADSDFGLLLIDYETEDFPVFRPVADLSEEDYARFRDAYNALRPRVKNHLIDYVRNQCGILLDFSIGIMKKSIEQQLIPVEMEDGTDFHVAAAGQILNAANSVFVYRDQRLSQAARIGETRDDRTLEKEIQLMLDQFYRDCDEYRWMIEVRNALVHLDLFAIRAEIKYEIGVEPKMVLNVDQDAVSSVRNLNTKKRQGENAKYLLQLRDMENGISIFDLVVGIGKKLQDFDSQVLDRLHPENQLYRHAEVVCEIIGRFEGRRGQYCFRNSPYSSDARNIGWTPLDGHVLAFAESIVGRRG